jgi:diguanylate cyclase (GGDEF)-like protein
MGAVTMTAIVVVRQVLVLRENQQLLTTDYLTGLSTRSALAGALARSLARSQRSGGSTAVLVIDLDGFKAVNDEFGHDAGDELLTGFAELLRAAVSRSDTVGRMGGDEFAVVLSDIARPDDAVAVALRLLDAMRRPLTVAGRPMQSRASIGIGLSRPGDTGRLIMHRADQAMYHAKRTCSGWSLEGGTQSPLPPREARADGRTDSAIPTP